MGFAQYQYFINVEYQILDSYDLCTSICYKRGGGGGGGRLLNSSKILASLILNCDLNHKSFQTNSRNGNCKKHSGQRDISAFSEISKYKLF